MKEEQKRTLLKERIELMCRKSVLILSCTLLLNLAGVKALRADGCPGNIQATGLGSGAEAIALLVDPRDPTQVVAGSTAGSCSKIRVFTDVNYQRNAANPGFFNVAFEGGRMVVFS